MWNLWSAPDAKITVLWLYSCALPYYWLLGRKDIAVHQSGTNGTSQEGYDSQSRSCILHATHAVSLWRDSVNVWLVFLKKKKSSKCPFSTEERDYWAKKGTTLAHFRRREINSEGTCVRACCLSRFAIFHSNRQADANKIVIKQIELARQIKKSQAKET